MTKRIFLIALPLAIALIGCSDMRQKPANNRDTMTQRQKDSVLGQSGLPGAQVVTKAMKMADSLNAIRKRQDSAMTKPDTGK